METKAHSASELVKRLEDEIKISFLSPKVVSERMIEIARASFARKICLRITYGNEVCLWGDVDDLDQLSVVNEGAAGESVPYEILAEASALKTADHELVSVLGNLAVALWHAELRSKGAIAFGHETVKRKICTSLRALASEGDPTLWVAFIDLDHFKLLNSQIGEAAADRVVERLNREFHEMARKFGGLVFNRSGDEFFVFLPSEGMQSMLEALHSMRAVVRSEPHKGFDGQIHHVDMTIGVIKTQEYATLAEVERATSLAEAQMKDPRRKNEKRRGRITIAREQAVSIKTCTPERLLKLGTALVRRRLHCAPFKDPNLAFVSSQVAGEMAKPRPKLDDCVKRAVEWLGLSMSHRCWEASLLVESGGDAIPRLAVALSVAHGMARAAFDVFATKTKGISVNISYSKDGKRAAVQRNGKIVWGTTAPQDLKFSIFKSLTRTGGGFCLVGVQVGLLNDPRTDGGEPLPADLFDRIVLIDERPISGGSLPDFWQPAVAEVYATLGRSKAKPCVVVWGKAAEDSETYAKLISARDFSIDEVAKVAMLSSTDVERIRDELKSSTMLVQRKDSLMNEVFTSIASWPTFDEDRCSIERARPARRSLTRPMLSRESLPLAAGVRCKTAAEAYPLVIDVLRKGENVLDSNDDANGRLKELRAFKLILDDPLRDDVPAYLEDQRAGLNAYAMRSMLDRKKGLFRKELESSRQIRAFIKHLTGYLQAPEPARSTRRACLVVPNKVGDDDELRPLGLVSVWASPRVGANRHLIDFVFVWRTVEAFVGLPYSLFGSIRLAENLLMMVTEEVPMVPNGRPPTVGELTYIPMSLHMRVGDFHDRIAKRIVDESSD